jgi:hypothetical protein
MELSGGSLKLRQRARIHSVDSAGQIAGPLIAPAISLFLGEIFKDPVIQ